MSLSLGWLLVLLFIAAMIVYGVVKALVAVVKWVVDLISAKIDSAIPCIKSFTWDDEITATVVLTDGTVLKGACGVWICDGQYLSDLGLRIALRKRYNEELEKRPAPFTLKDE